MVMDGYEACSHCKSVRLAIFLSPALPSGTDQAMESQCGIMGLSVAARGPREP
jgi:hypothetical protein